MKQLKRLTRKEKELLSSCRLNPDNWLVERRPPGELHIMHIHSTKIRVIKTA